MDTLKRSKDRKVTNAVMPSGKAAAIANTFGLPSGKPFSCPGATSVCELICYAGKLEKIYKGVREVLVHNWDLLRNADLNTMFTLLDGMVTDFEKDSDKRGADKLFRIHWDGDFFNDAYTYAWKRVVENHPDVQFWVYTRTEDSAIILRDIPNLSLYFSADSANLDTAIALREEYGIRLAYLADNFEQGQSVIKQITGKPGAKCPENKGALPLISSEGSACVRCGLCVFNKADIVFSASKK